MTDMLTNNIVFLWFLLNFLTHNMLVLGYTNNIKRLIDIEQIKNSTLSSGPKSVKCDFHGVKLKTITGRSVPYLMTESEYEKTTVFYSKTQTYDITNHCNGLMKDIVETLSVACNFTYEIHIRKDKRFGTITEYENGTIFKSGMFQSLLDDSGKSFLKKH